MLFVLVFNVVLCRFNIVSNGLVLTFLLVPLGVVGCEFLGLPLIFDFGFSDDLSDTESCEYKELMLGLRCRMGLARLNLCHRFI